jgi:sugar/nucleoside kinase (ribokinase family)
MMHYDVITIGGATEDVTFYTKEGVLIDNKEDIERQKLLAFEYGAKIKIDRVLYTFGGGAANAAVCLARLGFRVACLSAVGLDERGRHITENLRRHGVHVNLLQKIGKEESGFSFILIGPGEEHVAFLNRGANQALRIDRDTLSRMRDTELIYLTSLSGNWEQVLDKVFSLKKVHIHWNPGQTQIDAGASSLLPYLEKTAVLQLNKDEAISMALSDKASSGKSVKTLKNVKNLLSILKKLGPQIILITDGRKGAYAYDGEEIFFEETVKEKRVVDTTGVGDAFGSSFVAGLSIYKGDVRRAMKLAAFNASSVVQEQGAQNGLITVKDIKKLNPAGL